MVRFPVLAAAFALAIASALAAAAAAEDNTHAPAAATDNSRHPPAPAAAHHEAKAPAPASHHDDKATPAPHRADEHRAAAPHRAEERPPHRPPPHPATSRRNGCVSQRGTIALVQAGRVVRLSAIRSEAERRGNGELINAELCRRGGRLAYQVSVLGENGKVVHMSFDAASGRLEAAGR
ncbi:MAG TPA: hypothetical protein VHD15_14890 [Hyphomicrobiales bacterium]|nr:hypothetical protein [Hyphomicrobiales bacterium]